MLNVIFMPMKASSQFKLPINVSLESIKLLVNQSAKFASSMLNLLPLSEWTSDNPSTHPPPSNHGLTDRADRHLEQSRDIIIKSIQEHFTI